MHQIPSAEPTEHTSIMVTKSKLRLALAAEKGVDFAKLKQQKKQKEALKKKGNNGGAPAPVEDQVDESEEEEEEDDDDEEEELDQMDLDAINDSDTSESSLEFEEKIDRKAKKGSKPNADDDEDDEEEEEDEEDIPISDLEDLDDEDKEDLIPHTKLTIYNTAAINASLNRIALSTGKNVPFATHQSITSSAETASSIPDVSDDLQRELAFYTQSLEAVRVGRAKLRAEGVQFSRPKDYFAEMVKEDAHMEKVKAKLVEEASNKKAAAEARKLRDLKKFGKQVQVAKLQERQKAKRETLDKIKNLKRKRQESGGDIGTNEADLFDVGVDSELAKHSQRSGSGRGQMGASRGGQNVKRQKKNEKYGFGGKKRHSKSGDAASSGDLSGFNAKKMKTGGKSRVSKATRPGKSRRKAMSSR
ncbi:rRNA-processing protein EBP2 [Paramyrothecium foliicola]|nr:rRNA-processing protein EBP2 [Paramyrothecium foliicola]